MKITLTGSDGRALAAHQPHDHADRVVVDHATCPKCKLNPLPVRGQGKSIDPNSPRDTYRADAICCGCGAPVGVLRVKVETIFGIEEDDRVLNGRCRVY